MSATLIERIKSRCVECGDCWEWGGYMLHGIVPIMSYNGRPENVRRIVLLDRGSPMRGFVATYQCGNPLCVRPEHTMRCTRAQLSRRTAETLPMAVKVMRARKTAQTFRARHSKLTWDDVTKIRASDDRHKDLAKRYGVDESLIGQIRRGKVWKSFAASPFSGLI